MSLIDAMKRLFRLPSVIPVVLAGLICLVLAMGSQPGHWVAPPPAMGQTIQTTQEQPEPAITEPANRLKSDVAREVALSSVEEDFGRFNLFIIFFVTLGPLKIIPVFVQLTHHADRTLRRQLAFRSTAIATLVILLVVLIGRNLLKVWTIQLPALIIAGGILLAVVALRLILAQYEAKIQQAVPPETPTIQLAISPLAFPTILPPFGIAIALTLMIIATELGFRPILVIGLLLAIMALNLVCMLAARPIFKFVRPVTLRILGFTLSVMQFALGIQFVLVGLEVQSLAIKFLLMNN
jgi:multiple antibiotic resistance protein